MIENLKEIKQKFKAIKEKKEFELTFKKLLENLKEKYLVLYFYPKDLTPGCTNQAINLSENYTELKKKSIEIIGISIDDLEKHKKFIEKKEIPYILISDLNKDLVNLFGVWVEKNMYGRKYMGTKRTTFIFNKKGELISQIKKVKVKEHNKQIIENIEKYEENKKE
jgi:peroxiredoxin Q/BCP